MAQVGAGQHAHAPTVAGAPLQTVPSAADDPSLRWKGQDLTAQLKWSYIPSWSSPLWRPGLRIVNSNQRYILAETKVRRCHRAGQADTTTPLGALTIIVSVRRATQPTAGPPSFPKMKS